MSDIIIIEIDNEELIKILKENIDCEECIYSELSNYFTKTPKSWKINEDSKLDNK